MKQINTLSFLILLGSFSSTLLGMNFSFNEEYRKEEIKGMSRQQCLDFRTKQLHKLKEEAIKEILSNTGINTEGLDAIIKNHNNELNKYPLKKAYHDPTIPQEWLSIISQTLEEEGINPNNISIKTTNDSRFIALTRLNLRSKKNNKYVRPITLKINVDFIQENVIKENQRLFIQETTLHEISNIKNNDDLYWQVLKDTLLKKQIKHDPNSKNLNQKNTFLINKFTQSLKRIAMLNSSCKSKELAQYMNKEFQKIDTHNWPNYPPMEDVRYWSTRFCDCWNLPEEKSS